MINEMTVAALTEYINDNLEKGIVYIDELVSYSGYSRRYLQKIFKDRLGISLGKYIQLRRISRAAVYLRLTKLSLANISERLCYDSQQTFTREFKKNTGLTPQQYRKKQLWFFDKMIGCRNASNPFPIPDIQFINSKTIYGFVFKHKNKIPYSGMDSNIRLTEINLALSNADVVYLSNKIFFDDKSDDSISIESVIWCHRELANTKIMINSGFYACFRFTGTREQYSQFMLHIYMNVLPYYNLSKRDDFDIEIISKKDANTLSFMYLLPIY